MSVPVGTKHCLFHGESESRSAASDSLRPLGLYGSWNAPGQNTGVGSLSLLQRIFPTQGSNPGLLHCRLILYQLSHKRSLGIPEWAAWPFFSRSPRPRTHTGVSCTAGGFFTKEPPGTRDENSPVTGYGPLTWEQQSQSLLTRGRGKETAVYCRCQARSPGSWCPKGLNSLEGKGGGLWGG